ncbi:hypothetical protein K438DRAFT_1992372 [Mycena galopus ATCC 62051]|nr:hypothetical protein K438DRAFT_1992372 [Mycena galopus ATCC 62051]
MPHVPVCMHTVPPAIADESHLVGLVFSADLMQSDTGYSKSLIFGPETDPPLVCPTPARVVRAVDRVIQERDVSTITVPSGTRPALSAFLRGASSCWETRRSAYAAGALRAMTTPLPPFTLARAAIAALGRGATLRVSPSGGRVVLPRTRVIDLRTPYLCSRVTELVRWDDDGRRPGVVVRAPSPITAHGRADAKARVSMEAYTFFPLESRICPYEAEGPRATHTPSMALRTVTATTVIWTAGTACPRIVGRRRLWDIAFVPVEVRGTGVQSEEMGCMRMICAVLPTCAGASLPPEGLHPHPPAGDRRRGKTGLERSRTGNAITEAVGKMMWINGAVRARVDAQAEDRDPAKPRAHHRVIPPHKEEEWLLCVSRTCTVAPSSTLTRAGTGVPNSPRLVTKPHWLFDEFPSISFRALPVYPPQMDELTLLTHTIDTRVPNSSRRLLPSPHSRVPFPLRVCTATHDSAIGVFSNEDMPPCSHPAPHSRIPCISPPRLLCALSPPRDVTISGL